MAGWVKTTFKTVCKFPSFLGVCYKQAQAENTNLNRPIKEHTQYTHLFTYIHGKGVNFSIKS